MPSALSRESQGAASPGGCMFLFFLLICVTADGDDTDCGARGVRDDNRLPLPLSGGAGGRVTPPTGDWGAAGWAAVHHGTPWGSVLLDTLGSLRGAGRLGRGHFTGGDISVKTKQHTLHLHPTFRKHHIHQIATEKSLKPRPVGLHLWQKMWRL